jgi:hypothetical protein
MDILTERLFFDIPEFADHFNPTKILLVGREGIAIEEFLLMQV